MSKIDPNEENELPKRAAVTKNLEELLSIAMLTPMDDPRSPTCRWGAPTLLWGPPGIGKTGRIENVGLSTGLDVGTVYLSTHQPEDISGVFVPDGKGGVMTVCTLPQVNMLIKAGKGILLLDELTCARPAMQGAGLGVVYERFIAGQRLPGRIRVLAAANPPEEAAGGWSLAPPMANRFLHFEVGCPSVDDWNTWLLTGESGGVLPMAESEQTVQEMWNEVWPKIRGLGAGFQRAYRSIAVGKSKMTTLYHLPPVGHADRSRAWASPRSWNVALRCIATATCLGRTDLVPELLAASVGPGYTAAWLEWVSKANLPDPKDVLENGNWTPDPRRLDISFAVISSVVTYALSKPPGDEQKKYAIMAWRVVNTCIANKLSDIALAPASALMKAGYHTRGGADVEAVCRDAIAHFGTTGLSNYVRKRA